MHRWVPTRSLRGARLLLPAVACAWIAFAAAPAAASPPQPGPPPWRASGRMTFTVDAAGRPDSAGMRLDIYVRIPPSTLRRLETGDGGSTEVRITAELRSAYGARRQAVEQRLTLMPADTADAFGKVVLLAFRTRPGTQRLRVRLEDTRSHKTGIAYVGRVAHEAADVSGELELAAAQQGRELSDPEFAWDVRDAPSRGAFDRGGHTVIPNPERLYGALDSALQVAFTARSGDDARAWRWRARVLDARKTVVAERESSGVAGRSLEGRARMDLTGVPAGGYDLELSAWREGDARPLVRTARFGVAWDRDTWRRDPGDTEDLVHFLLGAAEEEQFQTLNPGEQERWLEDFWRRRDPTPDTPENEARNEFVTRIAIANQRYSRAGLEPGMYSDMGRVFIRYGEPTEIVRQVMPAGDETLHEMIQELSFSEGRSLGEIGPAGPGGDMRPFELWTYEGEIGLPLDVDTHAGRATRHQRLVFLFVDERGLGDYRLRYSNE